MIRRFDMSNSTFFAEMNSFVVFMPTIDFFKCLLSVRLPNNLTSLHKEIRLDKNWVNSQGQITT